MSENGGELDLWESSAALRDSGAQAACECARCHETLACGGEPGF